MSPKRRTDKLTLAPLSEDEALRALLATGPPPEDPSRAEERALARESTDEDSEEDDGS